MNCPTDNNSVIIMFSFIQNQEIIVNVWDLIHTKYHIAFPN